MILLKIERKEIEEKDCGGKRGNWKICRGKLAIFHELWYNPVFDSLEEVNTSQTQ